jgi:hypothetical protein
VCVHVCVAPCVVCVYMSILTVATYGHAVVPFCHSQVLFYGVAIKCSDADPSLVESYYFVTGNSLCSALCLACPS